MDDLETAVLVRDFLDHAELTEDEKQTARAAIHAYDENARTKHEQYEQKRKERQEKARARAEAKKAAMIEKELTRYVPMKGVIPMFT